MTPTNPSSGSGSGPGSDVLRLLAELPSGVALVGDAGELLEANAAFHAATGAVMGVPVRFSELFGAEPERFAVDERGRAADAVALGGRHYAVSARRVPGWGWLCQLQEVTHWIEGRAQAHEAATRDPLTGLANRAAFLPEVARGTEDPSRPAALLIVDLDRFKQVNDTLGHPVGDQLLCKVADRLRSSLRANDHVARLGGDEFAVLQVGAGQPAGSEILAKRLVEVLSRPYLIDGHMVDIGASIGVALAGGADADTLIKQADIALYRSKNTGRGRYSFFEASMDAEMQERRALELDLRRALAFRQFELHYQPQMSLQTQRLTGMEALIRWRHPTRGLVPPLDFIPLAEETGLIVPIGEWVIRQACEDAARWPGDMAIAVNVSAKQLASGKLVGAVAGALARTGVSPRQFEVEITESVLMADTEGCVKTLHALRELGVRVSMDDFGTGYSSLSYLRSFPFDKIKIDQSFVRSGDPATNDGIIRAIAAIGEHLGMATIAEGVETEDQLGQLTATGCGSIQGYVLSRPVPAGQVPGLIDQFRVEQPLVAEVVAAPATAAPASPAAPERDLYRLVYYSRNAIFGLDEEVLASVDAILAASKTNNQRAGVTGALMFTDGYFAQVLEGRRGEVERVFERIQLDDRHAEVTLLSFEPASGRVFPTWSMAFVGNAAASQAKFGHYAQSSGFDFAAAGGDEVLAHLRRLLLEEENAATPIAA